MPLTQLIRRHKRAVALSLAVALLVTAGLAFIWHDPVADETRAQSYGVNLASTLAAQGMEAMLQPDALHLSVLVNRMAAMPAVSAARFLDANDNPIAQSGPVAGSNGLTHTHAVRIGGVITGYAEVTLQPGSFTPRVSGVQLLATALLVLSMPLLAMMIGEWPERRRRPIPVVEFPDEEKAPEGPQWIALVNLYNQLAYPSEQRRAILARTLAQADQVAHLYQGKAQAVTGTGVVLLFDEMEDVAFKSVCASFLLLKLLQNEEPAAEYRFALHRLETPHVSPEVTADVALLAALAREGTVLATPTFADSLQKAERLVSDTFTHPMLSDVDIVDDRATAITDLSEKHSVLIEQQASAVLGGLPGAARSNGYSTSSASTR